MESKVDQQLPDEDEQFTNIPEVLVKAKEETKDEIQREREQLPIHEFKDQIVDMVTKNLFCIITGETGSGKSTQIAQYLIDGLQPGALQRMNENEIHAMLGVPEGTI